MILMTHMRGHKKHIEEIIKFVYRNWRQDFQNKGPCPGEETLACFIDGLLSRREDRGVKLHLLQCQGCLEKVMLSEIMQVSA